MKNRGHVSIILGIVFLLSAISLSSAQIDESSQDELPRILDSNRQRGQDLNTSKTYIYGDSNADR